MWFQITRGPACFEFAIPIVMLILVVLFLRHVLRVARTGHGQARRDQARHGQRRKRGGQGRRRGMRRFSYMGRAADGTKVEGFVFAPSEENARSQIEDRNEVPIWLRSIDDDDDSAQAREDRTDDEWTCKNDLCRTINVERARFCKTCGFARSDTES